MTTDGGAGERLSRVVLARPRGSAGFAGLVGMRWEVDLSKAGVAIDGGVGAGRYGVGPEMTVDPGGDAFFGGGGGER